MVISAPTSTTNMTGLRTCTRGSSFLNEAPIAGHRISGVNRDFDARAASPAARAREESGWRSSAECLVELGGVDARLAEQAEEAAVGVVVDELLDAVEREAAHGGDAARLDAGVGDGDVRVDARAGRRDGVGRDLRVRQAGVVRAVELDVGGELVAVEVRARSAWFGPRLEKNVAVGVVVRSATAAAGSSRGSPFGVLGDQVGVAVGLGPNATCEIPVIDERIDEAEQDREDDHGQGGGDEVPFHGLEEAVGHALDDGAEEQGGEEGERADQHDDADQQAGEGRRVGAHRARGRRGRRAWRASRRRWRA